MQMAVDRGLGTHKGSLSAAHLDQYHKVRGHYSRFLGFI